MIEHMIVSAMQENNTKKIKLLSEFFTPEIINRLDILHFAVQMVDMEAVELLLDRGADVNCKDQYQNTPLHLAIEKKDLEIVELLLDRGADVNCKDQYQNTPLHLAIEKKDLEIVELLLDRGADVNCKDQYQNTPLHLAIEKKDLEIVELLLREKADLTIRDDWYGYTPLYYAVDQKNWLAFFMLLTFGADPSEEEREQINNNSETFAKYLSIFEEIKDETYLNKLLEVYVNGSGKEEFQSYQEEFIKNLSKIRERHQGLEKSLAFNYIYGLILHVKVEHLLHYSLTSRRKLFATGALAGIIEEYSHKQGKCINPAISMESCGYGLEGDISSLSYVSRTVRRSAKEHSETYWKQEKEKVISFLTECNAICSINNSEFMEISI